MVTLNTLEAGGTKGIYRGEPATSHDHDQGANQGGRGGVSCLRVDVCWTRCVAVQVF